LFIVAKMVPQTRLAKARPSHEEHLENAALRNRMKKGHEKAQQQSHGPANLYYRLKKGKRKQQSML